MTKRIFQITQSNITGHGQSKTKQECAIKVVGLFNPADRCGARFPCVSLHCQWFSAGQHSAKWWAVVDHECNRAVTTTGFKRSWLKLTLCELKLIQLHLLWKVGHNDFTVKEDYIILPKNLVLLRSRNDSAAVERLFRPDSHPKQSCGLRTLNVMSVHILLKC